MAFAHMPACLMFEMEAVPVFRPVDLRANSARIQISHDPWIRIEGPDIVLSWAAVNDLGGKTQSAYRVRLFTARFRLTDGVPVREETPLLDSGWVASEVQRCHVEIPLPRGVRIRAGLRLRDENGNESEEAYGDFFIADIDWTAPWIRPVWDDPHRPAYFRKCFLLDRPVKEARLYICGLGYFEAKINGRRIWGRTLDPAHTDYSKTCQFVLFSELDNWVKQGENTIEVTVAAGWRANDGHYLRNAGTPSFFGPLQLSAILIAEYEDGSFARVETGADWECGQGPIVFSHLFDGEIFDARMKEIVYQPAELADAPGGIMRPMTIPPVGVQKRLDPVSVSHLGEDWLLDFGENIAGVGELTLDKRALRSGQTITMRYAERLNADGTPYFDNLRGAKATDTYIEAERCDVPGDIFKWSPRFTYHGFRYILLSGISYYDCICVAAVQLCSQLESTGRFRSGSAVINAIQDMIVRTERDNMHSILTDCPQRDERMGWMNDATVRFAETPYNFDATVMFRKICRDICDAQKPDGAIACTAPKIYGAWPADPVCSSFLIAGLMAYLHGGDLSVIKENYNNYARWENCLLENSEGFIVRYSYYGDWAGPAYACMSGENAKSAVTPGEFMSTGFSYYNCRLLKLFSELLNKTDEAAKYDALSQKIASAMLDKWYDAKTRRFAPNSMACRAFALWLDILPEEDRAFIAKGLRDDLVQNEYLFTTGNLCTVMLLEALSRYGYIDEAYELITRQEYPSFGWMLQNEATTVWERFELKDNGGMNSYCHPMYGSVGSWFYSSLAGLRPTDEGWKHFSVKPCLPRKLLSCQASVRTPFGEVFLRWVQRDGKAYLQLDVPFGAEAEVEFGENKTLCKSGHHSFCTDCF